MTCPLCDGFGYLLGCLGKLAWFRCRQCGMEYNVPADTIEPELEDSND